MPWSDRRNNVARSDVDAEWLALPGCDHAQLFVSENFAAGVSHWVWFGTELAGKISTLGRRRREIRRDFSFFSLCRRFPVFKFHILENEIRAFP
jgi:hypothetical protein